MILSHLILSFSARHHSLEITSGICSPTNRSRAHGSIMTALLPTCSIAKAWVRVISANDRFATVERAIPECGLTVFVVCHLALEFGCVPGAEG